jgi:predicted dithiol-disulfide oxidoreductase (DUF899 family)/dihydrofolate reductase
MYPDYGAYWESIEANPDRVPPFQEQIPTKSEVAYARLAAKTPHIVLSTTLTSVSWPPTAQVIRDVAELRTLKSQPGKNMYVVGGATLVASLLNENLIDELRLIIHPIVLGKGQGTVQQCDQASFARSRPGQGERIRTSHRDVPKESRVMTTHKTGTREEWLAARLELLDAEKALTRRGDELARQRQELPWVRIDKAYRFETEEGNAALSDLFRGRSQLLMYHFMFGPDYTAGCPACSAIADGFNGFAVHLANHDVMLWAVSRAPFAKLQAYRQRMGWTFPWASSFGSDFNGDFNVWFSEQQQREGGNRIQLPARSPRTVTRRPEARARRPVARRPVAHHPRRGHAVRFHDRNRQGDLHARAAGYERVRARGWGRLSHLFRLCARTRWFVGHVSVARSRADGAQRDGRLVPSPRRVQA